MKTKKIKITFCPNCREYLARTEDYKLCMYCGYKYNIQRLIIKSIEVFNGFVDGQIYRKEK